MLYFYKCYANRSDVMDKMNKLEVLDELLEGHEISNFSREWMKKVIERSYLLSITQ